MTNATGARTRRRAREVMRCMVMLLEVRWVRLVVVVD
jgi:hypothetical protein